MNEYGAFLMKLEDVKDSDCVTVAVSHNEFKAVSLEEIKKLFKALEDYEKVIIDVKGLQTIFEFDESG